jgi:hypothetical protein
MTYYTKDGLIKSLKGKTHAICLNSSGQGTAVISEYGGRLLGLFPDEENHTLLWVNKDLEHTIKNRNRDIGGDRFWLSPERTFFYKQPESWRGWYCPESLDPANYRILEKQTKKCQLYSEISVKNHFTEEIYKGEIKREFKLITESSNTGVPYIGIETIEKCTLNKPDLLINGWNLTNIISGGPKNPGTVLIPTKALAKPLSYFRIIPDDRLIVKDNYIGFKIDVDSIYKLAIRPEDIDFARDAKIAYVIKIPNSEKYGFLVKLSDDVPKTQKECFDEARDHPDCEIGVIQSYNAESPNKNDLRYGEIELQLNKFKTKGGKSTFEASHQIFSYIGSKKEISSVIEKYLGIENPKLFN